MHIRTLQERERGEGIKTSRDREGNGGVRGRRRRSKEKRRNGHGKTLTRGRNDEERPRRGREEKRRGLRRRIRPCEERFGVVAHNFDDLGLWAHVGPLASGDGGAEDGSCLRGKGKEVSLRRGKGKRRKGHARPKTTPRLAEVILFSAARDLILSEERRVSNRCEQGEERRYLTNWLR